MVEGVGGEDEFVGLGGLLELPQFGFDGCGTADDGGGESGFDGFAFGIVPEAVHRIDWGNGKDGLAAD